MKDLIKILAFLIIFEGTLINKLIKIIIMPSSIVFENILNFFKINPENKINGDDVVIYRSFGFEANNGDTNYLFYNLSFLLFTLFFYYFTLVILNNFFNKFNLYMQFKLKLYTLIDKIITFFFNK